MNQLAKVFQNGRSQAVRLPAAFRFDAKEVYVRRDPASGDVILSRRPGNWEGLFALIDLAKAEAEAAGFMRKRVDGPSQGRELF